jgi:hypothetical protein
MRRDIWEASGWSSNQNPNNPRGYRAKKIYFEIISMTPGIWRRKSVLRRK